MIEEKAVDASLSDGKVPEESFFITKSKVGVSDSSSNVLLPSMHSTASSTVYSNTEDFLLADRQENTGFVVDSEKMRFKGKDPVIQSDSGYFESISVA